MSIMETVLTRAMSDPAFAEALFADPEKALAEYHLPGETIEKFKNIGRAEFNSMDAEERKSLSAIFGWKNNINSTNVKGSII